MTEVLPRRRDVPYRNIGNETMVRDPERKLVHFLNSTATLVWECLDGATTEAACLERIRETVPVPADVDLAADVKAVLADFRSKHLIDEA